MASKIDRLSVTLVKILSARQLQSRLHEYRIVAQWARTVGPSIAHHAQPRTFKGGRLTIVVDSPAWMQQLSLMKPEIMQKLNARLGMEKIRDITMKLGEVEPTLAVPVEDDQSTMVLSADDQRRIEQCSQTIGDQEIRESVRRVFEKDLLNRKKKKRT